MDGLELDDDDILNLTKVQSLYRRNYVQNEMFKLREEYEKIFLEIEGEDTETQITWPNEHKLCCPKFSSKKTKTQNKTQNQQQMINETKSDKTVNSDKKLNNSKNEKTNINKSELENDDKNTTLLNNTQNELFNLDIDAKQLDYLRTDNLKKLNINELNELKENVSLEILWIQQAIQSRIQYLNLKKTIENNKKSSSS